VREILEIAGAIIVSIGGAGVLLVMLSSWLGKVWAERILAQDRERFRRESEAELAHIRAQIDLVQHRSRQEYLDKLAIYRSVVDMVASMVVSLDQISVGRGLTEEQRVDFQTKRLRAYGYAAMIAPQRVMDCFDALIEHLLYVFEGAEEYDFFRVRRLAVEMLNAIREDVAGDKSPIAYRGSR
jgi:hypothetical protein